MQQSDRGPSKIRAAGAAFLSRPYLFAITFIAIILLIVTAATTSTMLEHHQRIPLTIENFTSGPPIQIAINENFPDPSILFHNHTWYAYATNNAAGIFRPTRAAFMNRFGVSHVQLATSIDFIRWELHEIDPLPRTGEWAIQGLTLPSRFGPSIPRAGVWAPSVIQRPSDKKYVLYYSANSNGPTIKPYGIPTHCIGAAIADSPMGPFDALEESLACPFTKGGAIDPYGFVDKDGSIYVAYKIDGNSIGHGGLCGNTVLPIVSTPIMLQKMMSDGLSPDGYPIQILDRTDIDGPLVEAPAIIRSHEGIYYLFYSSGCTQSPTYDVKYASARSVDGPYVRVPESLLATGDWGLEAPGSVGMGQDANGAWNIGFPLTCMGSRRRRESYVYGELGSRWWACQIEYGRPTAKMNVSCALTLVNVILRSVSNPQDVFRPVRASTMGTMRHGVPHTSDDPGIAVCQVVSVQ